MTKPIWNIRSQKLGFVGIGPSCPGPRNRARTAGLVLLQLRHGNVAQGSHSTKSLVFPFEQTVFRVICPKLWKCTCRVSEMPNILRAFFVFAAAQLLAAPVWAQEDYKIKPGDVVRIEVLEDSTINRESLVLPDGRVTVPLAGTVKVGGRSVDEVRSEVAGKLSENFASEPTVFVSLVRLAEPSRPAGSVIGSARVSIYFLGEVNKPGMLEVRRGTTLLQALAQAGGFSRFAAVKRVQLRRTDATGKQQIYSFNYKDVLEGRSSIGSTQLGAGDVIVVPTRKLFE